MGGAIVLVLMTGCAAGTGRTSAARQIEDLLGRQAADWNRGDIEAFMEPYWHDSGLTFSAAGRVTRGWQATLDGYRKRYPDRAAMGRLTFDQLEVFELARDAAFVLGRWHLERAEPVGGAFTLVLQRRDGRWTIIHDHTSRDEGV
jgi:beta-aspartyl-peptidase (threonine type)